MFGDLKRFWTKFLREDYDIYLKSGTISTSMFVKIFKCVCNYRSRRGLNDVIIGVKYQSDARKKLSKCKIKKKRSKSPAQFEIDGTPLELFGDME